MPSDSPVRVVCRFRPPSERELLEAKQQEINEKEAICVTINEEVQAVIVPLHSSPQPIEFYMDDVLPMSVGQEDAFYRVAEPTIKDIMRGYNGTIFAYGQTGSGKTHSMYGPEGKFNAQESGLVPRAISMLFQSLEDKDEIKEFTMKVSFIEIYMEKMRDLLGNAILTDNNDNNKKKKNKDKLSDDPKSMTRGSSKSTRSSGKAKAKVKKDFKSLRVRTLPNGQTYIQNLMEQDVESLMDVLALISNATKERTTSATNMNRTSSRSHLVMILGLEQKMIDGSIRVSKLNFADLAGSEKVKKTQASGQRLEEAKTINKSLSQLGLVIRALSEKKEFISYRDSVLTHILKDSLGGNTKTTLLCTCSPHIFNRDETISTLRFATRAKLITNVVYKNTVLSPQQMADLIKQLQGEISGLKSKLQDKVIKEMKENEADASDGFAAMKMGLSEMNRKRSSMFVNPELHKQLIADLEKYKVENANLKNENESLKSREEELKKQIAELKSQLTDEKDRYEQLLLKIEELTDELNKLKLQSSSKDKVIEQLKNKITDLNAKLMESASQAEKKGEMQLEFLSVVYEGRLKSVDNATKDIDHQYQLVKQRLDHNGDDKKDAEFRMEKGDLTEIDFLKQMESLEYEKQYLAEQETRLSKMLELFEKEKELLTKQKTEKEATLQEQIETLTKYLDLKDSQLNDMRKDLTSLSEQMQNKDNKLSGMQDENRQLKEKLKQLEDENKTLNQKISGYFSFEQSAPNTMRSGRQSSNPWDSIARGRGATVSGQVQDPSSTRSPKAMTFEEEDGSPMVDVETYFVEFAKMRAEREKQQKLEREKEKEKQKEMEAKRKSIEIQPSKVEKVSEDTQTDTSAKSIEDYAKDSGLELDKPKSTQHVRDRTSSKDFSTVNRYGKKKRRKSKTKFGRSKVAAMIAGFEQIEKKDQVFDSEEEEEDDMLLNMLPTNVPNAINVEKWTIEDVCSWLSSINLEMYHDIVRDNKIDGSILYNDISTEDQITKMGVSELHAKKLLREINLLKNEQNITYDDPEEEDEKDGFGTITVDPFEMIKELYNEIDSEGNGYITLEQFKKALDIVDVKLANENQIVNVYNSFHFGTNSEGITEEEMLLTLGKVFTEHSCNNAKTAFRLACVYFLQAQGLMDGSYMSHLEDLFENSDEVKKNLDTWKGGNLQDNIGVVKPFLDEKLMKLMKVAGQRVVVIDDKRIPTIEEFDDMQCARMAGDCCHLSVLKIWWMQSTIFGMQSTYTSADGKHFTTIRHCTPHVTDDNEDMNETVITLKHDEFIKYCSIGATHFVHYLYVVTTLGAKFTCGLNRSEQIIQFKPPSGCGILAFFGSITKSGMSSLGVYAIRNEKAKLRSMTAAGVEQAHQRAKLRAVLKNKIKKNISLEEAIGHIMDNYSELQVRELIEGNDKSFFKQVLADIESHLKPKPMQKRKVSFLGFSMK